MHKDDVIEQFCELATLVGDNVYHNKYAHDCFCPSLIKPNFQFDSQIIQFIKDAVKEKIARIDNG
jgi:hypothetical protein